ncbi:MAG: flagellar biosynthesis protein FliQ [Oscillospiraceae bacterium]|nr:flagellar biosynthesis protein FliQ [Oscillospiraceae bacterium]
MTQEIVLEIFTAGLWLAFRLAAPMLIAAMGIGLVIAILQAATQIQEQTLSFAPKLIGISIALLVFGPWMMQQIIDYVTFIFGRMSEVGL